jgi:hypothetical protein
MMATMRNDALINASKVLWCGVLAALAPLPSPAAMTVDLQPRTSQAFEVYMRAAEPRLLERERGGSLWLDGAAARKQAVREGKVLAESVAAKGGEIPDGLIHDWVGAAFIPGATIDQVLALVQDYDHHKDIYKPEVVDSRLLNRNGSEYQIFLRLLKKKVLTVVLNTNHDVRYSRPEGTRCYARSYATRVAELADAGEKDEHELAPGKGHGFLWRLNSFWRYEERDGGVYVECEAISLTRDVPTGLGWLINPIIRNLPRDSLVNTLRLTKAAVLAR